MLLPPLIALVALESTVRLCAPKTNLPLVKVKPIVGECKVIALFCERVFVPAIFNVKAFKSAILEGIYKSGLVLPVPGPKVKLENWLDNKLVLANGLIAGPFKVSEFN